MKNATRMAAVALAGVAAGATAQVEQRAVFTRTFPNAAPGYASSLLIEDDGNLTLVGAFATSDTGPQAISLSPDGRWLAVAHGTSNNISENLDVFEVMPDGTLEYVSTTDVPDSPLTIAWVRPDRLAVTQTSFGGSNSVGMYAWDGLTLVEIDREDAGGFSSEIAVHPHGRFLYANDTWDNALRVFEILEDGSLAPVQLYPTGGLYQFGLGFSPDGRALYAGGGISGGGSAVLGFDVDLSTGELEAMPGSPFFSPGSSPNEVDVEDEGLWAYVSHGTDATLRAFSVEPDGSLQPTGFSFDIGLQGSLGETDTLGDLVLVTDNTTATDDIAGIYSFRIDPLDGDLVQVDFESTGSSTPDGLEIWDPARGVHLSVSEIVPGQRAQFMVTNATPGEPTGLVYSVRGPGRTFVPRIGMSLGLLNAVKVGATKTADADGEVAWMLPVPATQVDDVWFQAAQVGRVSNVVQRRVR